MPCIGLRMPSLHSDPCSKAILVPLTAAQRTWVEEQSSQEGRSMAWVMRELVALAMRNADPQHITPRWRQEYEKRATAQP